MADAAEAVVDLLDRVVHRGAVVHGNVVISLAGIDLVRLDLRLLLLGLESGFDVGFGEAPG
ncbi:gas vesicle protein GvpJ [Amycolatopsis sp. NPDC088138]|uniref:gas vesicle protein GvpJ n=1 Tax=Amycolatopsis sp. NPDC088138 TaxID=3363938 RepID=UPI0038202980